MTFTDFETVLELRRYTLHPGRRDELIELFEREFVEPQEAAGAHLFGLFRSRAAPDHFVWLRGFRSMESRKAALEEFYFGPVWKEHRDAANATMLDSDDVLLLRPLRRGLATPPPGTGLHVTISPRFGGPTTVGLRGVRNRAVGEHVPAAAGAHRRPVVGVVQPRAVGDVPGTGGDCTVTDPLNGVRPTRPGTA
ncbi:NIPSNAP family protein [Amycolatopsis sp. NEAU-NG30]|uniref:NIPSNAP family protein n=1 Tax=Amycolatopsis melonis TaxID=3156488 RepID=A0ABV0LR42_9PSEU